MAGLATAVLGEGGDETVVAGVLAGEREESIGMEAGAAKALLLESASDEKPWLNTIWDGSGIGSIFSSEGRAMLGGVCGV